MLNLVRLKSMLSAFAIVGLGGMLFCAVTLWLAQGLASFWEDGRIFDPADGLGLWILLLVIGIVMTPTLIRTVESDVDSYNLLERDLGRSSLALLVLGVLYILVQLWDYDLLDFGFLSSVVLGVDVCVIIFGLLVSGAITYLTLQMLQLSSATRILMVALWIVGYLISWTIGIATGGLSLPIFGLVWLCISILGVFICDMTPSTVEPRTVEFSWSDKERKYSGQSTIASQWLDLKKRREQTRPIRSLFGRLPEDTMMVFGHLIRKVTGPIAAALPVEAPISFGDVTVKEVLDRLIIDWRSNENLHGLERQDIEDIRSFVQAAYYCGRHHYGPVKETVYRVCLGAFMDDWLENWNANGTSGPPA
ncbi:MAG: hypothetical protein K2X29_02750 [Candidatus Obscuribacterales bacterium]|nr:hypothetical protein [Candidatus Obscuribacterales bacterium]